MVDSRTKLCLHANRFLCGILFRYSFDERSLDVAYFDLYNNRFNSFYKIIFLTNRSKLLSTTIKELNYQKEPFLKLSIVYH